MPERNVTRRIVAPSDVVIILGIPTTRVEVEHAWASGSEFVHMHASVPDSSQGRSPTDRYSRDVLGPLNRILPEVQELGAQVVPYAGLGDLQLASRTGKDVIVVITHSTDEAIELRGTMYSHRAVADLFSAQSEVLFDAITCGSRGFGSAVKAQCPGSRVCVADSDIYPIFWMYVLWCVLQRLSVAPCTYIEACDACADLVHEVPLQTLEGEHV